MFIRPPPSLSALTTPPDDYVAPTPGEFRTVAPRKSELAALPQAVIDAKNFTEYSQMIGGNGPSLDAIVQTYDLARQWSTMRQASAKWDAYCALQEGLAWQALRGVNVHLGPAYSLALVLNPNLSSRLPGLTSLLQAKQAISKKGASTRKLNAADVANGLLPSHGEVGKRNQRRAAKAALAAQKAAAAAAVVKASAQPAAQSNGSVDSKPATVVTTSSGATVASGSEPS
jgi:hypothetical protein